MNCPGIPHDLVESELFGYEKGAFTGATARKTGKFELAHGGTLFLDEIGEMSPEMQAKVLRAVEHSEIYRVGGTVPIKADVRLICATNKKLKEEVDKGTFREDLFYRLNVVPVYTHPLRKRKEDIPILLDHFLGKHNTKNSGNIKRIAPTS